MKKKTNIVLLIILLILIIITTVLIVILNLKNKDDSIINEGNIGSVEQEETIRYDNGETSYYDYYKEGLINIDISKYVKLPKDYLEYKIDSDEEGQINTILDKIVENSEVEIPIKLLNGYYGDVYNDIKSGADSEKVTLDEYIKKVYGYDSYQKFIEENTKYYEESVKKDLVYQALAKSLNITITKHDVEDYFSSRLENGDTYESLMELYGEELMYKYTMKDKIEKALIQRISQ